MLIPTAYFSSLNNKEYKNCISQILSPDAFVIVTNEVQCPRFFDRLIVRCIPSEKSEYYCGFLGDPWIERFYDKADLCFLPKRFLDKTQDSEAFLDFSVETDLPFYARIINPGMSIGEIRIILSPPRRSDVPFFLRPFMRKFDRWSTEEVVADKWRKVTLPHGQTFLIVGKNHLVDDRVKSIDFR